MIRAGIILAVFATFTATAAAHHGFGTFDLSKQVSFKGKLTRIEFINPHSWLYFEVTDANGKVSRHRCEMRSAHTLRRSGWSRELFPIGQQVSIEAAPDRKDPNSCYLNTILFENGSRMDRYGQYVKAPDGIKEVRGPVTEVKANRPARRPTGEPNISGDWAPEQVVMADPRGTGGGLVPLSRIGERPREGEPPAAGRGNAAGRRGGGAPAGPRLYGGTELTDAGTAAVAKFTQADNPRFKCQTTSIIFDWTFDGPVNRITQNRDDIVIEYGQLNLRRTIHMNRKTPPAGVKPSRAGYSVGRWEKDVLVVETTNFAPGILTGQVPNSNQLKVVERFTLDPKTMELTRAYTATDPVYLKGTYTGSDKVGIADAPYTKDQCDEKQFIDYSKQANK